MPIYLREERYYEDIYDRVTIEECRQLESRFTKENVPKKKDWVNGYAHYLALWALTGERYAKKHETVRRWINRDRGHDEALRNARVPNGISCLACGSPMEHFNKDFWTQDDTERIQFFFCCTRCRAMRVFLENGEEYRPSQPTCTACGSAADKKHSRTGDEITTVTTCATCHHVTTDVLDLRKPQPVIDKDFTKDRERFCLSQEDGGRYVEQVANIRSLTERMTAKEANRELHDAVSKLQTLTVTDLEKLLIPALEKHGFGRLAFQNPESIKSSLWIGFTVQDLSNRQDYDSKRALSDAVARTVQTTNWKLGSDGLRYSLGILSGRLRGVGKEDDLLELVRMRKRRMDATNGETAEDA